MKIAPLLIILVAALALASCSGPQVEEDDITLNFNSQAGQDQAAINQQTTQAQLNSQANQPSTNKGTMKTLPDFEPITASQATLTTTKGDITFELYQDKTPVTVANFLDLAKSGYYEGIVFHRVIPDFMAQVGDPTTKDPAQQARWGTGGPGYTIPDEFVADLKHDSEGIVSMANTGQPATGGSQFFITFGPTPWLDGKHTVFGKVTQGLEVLRQIEQGDKIISISYQ